MQISVWNFIIYSYLFVDFICVSLGKYLSEEFRITYIYFLME
jgi:hypothetical protein